MFATTCSDLILFPLILISSPFCNNDHNSPFGILSFSAFSGSNIPGLSFSSNKYGNQTWFLLNKQAAFMNKVVLCEDESDSPLGPIKIILESDAIDNLINSLIENKFLLK